MFKAKYYKTLLISVLALFIFNFAIPAHEVFASSPTMDCKHIFTGWDENCLMPLARAKFNISISDISDTALLQYVGNNKQKIASLLLERDSGDNIAAFIGNSTNDFWNADKDYIDILDSTDFGFWGDIANVFAVANDSLSLTFASESLGFLNTVIGGIEAYRALSVNLTAWNMRSLFSDYIVSRHNGNTSDAAWSDIMSVWSVIVHEIMSLNGISEQALKMKFENGYLAYRLVGYGSESVGITNALGRSIVQLAIPSSGQPAIKILAVPAYDQDNFGYGCINDCAPTAGAMLLGYYDTYTKGGPLWPRLVPGGPSAWSRNPSGVRIIEQALSESMGFTCNESTKTANVVNSIVNIAHSMDNGMYFAISETAVDYSTASQATKDAIFAQIKDSIADNRPVVIAVSKGFIYHCLASGLEMPLSGAHLTIITGYIDYGTGNRNIVLNSGWGGDCQVLTADYAALNDVTAYFTFLTPTGTPTKAVEGAVKNDNYDPQPGATGSRSAHGSCPHTVPGSAVLCSAARTHPRHAPSEDQAPTAPAVSVSGPGTLCS